jgi:secreted trypsin-like serine protease
MLLHVFFMFCVVCSKLPSVVGILKGHDIDIEKRPYQVFIQHNRVECAGVVLNKEFVITAAHCVERPVFSRVFAGSNYSYGGEVHYVTKRYIHPLYVNHGNNWTQFDVALLELESKLNYSAKVQPIVLPASNQSYSDGLLCHVSGWGLTEIDDWYITDQLQTVTVKIVQRENCTREYLDFAAIDDSMICGGSERAHDVTGPCIVSPSTTSSASSFLCKSFFIYFPARLRRSAGMQRHPGWNRVMGRR